MGVLDQRTRASRQQRWRRSAPPTGPANTSPANGSPKQWAKPRSTRSRPTSSTSSPPSCGASGKQSDEDSPRQYVRGNEAISSRSADQEAKHSSDSWILRRQGMHGQFVIVSTSE